MKRNIIYSLFIFFSLVYFNLNAQELRVIDNKGTRKNINKVTKNNTGIKPSTNIYSGDIYIDESNGEVFIYDGKNSTWEPFTQYWSLKGNSGLTNDNFLGTIDDVKLQLRSENKTILELGKRSTLGLSTLILGDDPLAHIKNGGSNYSTIQFEAANISSHGKPIIRASADNFVIRSGIPTDDYFQIRSVANSATDGSLEFEIGDDGNEPFVFKSQNNSLGSKKELFRVQGNDTSIDSKPRFGINTNGTMANSTLQVEGSVSKSIFETTANLTLTEEHHTIVLGGDHAITLPAASSCEGRTYIIRNPTNATTTISSYVDLEGNPKTTIFKNSVLKLQSNNTNWLKINNKGNETITSISQSASNTNTQVAANTANTIATYTNENGSNTTINETVTSLSFRTVTGDTSTANTYFIDYLDENGSTNNIEVSGLTYKGTPGSVFFAGSDRTIDERNEQFFWNNTNSNPKLHIGSRGLGNPINPSGSVKLNVYGGAKVTSGIKLNDGSASLPSYRFNDDSNTGMWSSNDDNLNFSTDGTEAMNINASQTVTVNNDLHVIGNFIDSSGDIGTSGQILSSTGIGTNWIDSTTGSTTNNNWSLTGNSGTNPSTNFLGTTDNNDLVLKTNNIERIRFGHITFPNNSEILINRATQNSFPRSFPLIIKANGTSIFGFEDSESNDFWDWSLFKQGHLSLQLRGNSNPRIVLLKNPWNGVGIGGNPASTVNFHVHGNVRIDDLANVSSFDKFVVAEADGDLRSIDPSSIYSTVNQTVMSGNEIATHSSGGTTTVTSIYETVTTLNNTISGHKIADYTNENGSNTTINETITLISQSASNTNTQVTANTANTIATYRNENGSNTTINETVTSLSQNASSTITYTNEKGSSNTAQVVSADANNNIKVGSDGGAYIQGPTIIASGQVSSSGTCICSGASASYNSSFKFYYIDGFTAPSGANRYVIQLTLEAPPINDWSTQIYYYDKNFQFATNGDNFKVKIIDGLGSLTSSDKRVTGNFSFVIISIP